MHGRRACRERRRKRPPDHCCAPCSGAQVAGAACAAISRRRCWPGHSRPASTCSIPTGCALVQVRRWHTLECGARTSSEGRSRGGTEHEEVQTTRRMVAGGAGAGAGAGVSIYAFVCCVRAERGVRRRAARLDLCVGDLDHERKQVLGHSQQMLLVVEWRAKRSSRLMAVVLLGLQSS